MVKEALLSPEDPGRWTALVIFSFFSCSNAFQWVTFASIESRARDYFNLTTMELNLLSMIFMVVFVLGVIFTCTVFEHWGVRKGLLMGTTCNALGAVLKFTPGLQYPSFTTMMIAQSINAVAQLFVLSTPPLLAAQYFQPDRRVFANAVASTANLIGSAAGLLVPAFIVRDPVKEQFEILFGIQLALCCLVFFATVFFLKSPQRVVLHICATEESFQTAGTPRTSPHAPEPADECTGAEGEPRRCCGNSEQWRTMKEVLVTVKTLASNRDFMFLLGAFSITTGSIWSVASVLAQVYEPYGISQQLAGVSGAGNVLAGTVAAYLAGIWVDHYRRYKLPIILCLSGSVTVALCLMIVFLCAPPDTNTIRVCCVFLVIFAGLFQITAVPLCFEFAMEITYPIRESVPGALMMAASNLVSLLILVAASIIIGDDSATQRTAVYTLILILSVSVLGLISSCFPRETLSRWMACATKQRSNSFCDS